MRATPLLAPLVALPLLVGCSETSINAGYGSMDPPNPPDLEVPTRVDRTVQVTVPSVDVLFVIDNSCSMEEEQAALAQNFAFFIDYFLGSDLDYHVGVLSTGWDDAADRGKLRQAGTYRWIDESVTDPETVFRTMSIMGTGGPSEEKGRAQVYGAIELLGEHTNKGFYRDDAALAVVVVSDEDDASGNSPIGKGAFVSWLRDLKEDPSQVSFSSIVGTDACPDIAHGTDYLDVTAAVGGIDFPICNRDWSQVLEDLGVQAAGLKREFYLSEVPVDGTLSVWIQDGDDKTPYDFGIDYVYSRSRNSVVFIDFVPEPLTEIYVSYQPLAASQASDD